MRKSVYHSFLFLRIAFIVSVLFVHVYGYAGTLQGVRVWPAPDETRVVIDLSNQVHYSYFTLSNPYRVVVDLQQTVSKARFPLNVKNSPILKKIRTSTPPSASTYRLVFELKSKASPQLFTLEPQVTNNPYYRLVIDLPHRTSTQLTPPALISRSHVAKDVSQMSGRGDIVVAVDAGHGGEDPGSIGPHRKFEKDVTLMVAKKLAAQLNQISGMKAVLTRKGDYYVSLNRRTEIARQHKAHLLISIHADAFRSPIPRGASVFVLNTKRANSEIAKWVEDHEKQSELLGGTGEVLAKSVSDKNVSQTLLDLQFSHSQKEGYILASDILAKLGEVAHLHKRKPVNASLAVLKSPDIPSVLVETGFISNPDEEKLLFQRTHQNRLASAIATAVAGYFRKNPPAGTLLASQKMMKKHVVKSGESLSLIANQYGVTTQALISENRLKSSRLKVSQVLAIPNASVTGTSVHRSSISASLPGPKTQTTIHVVRSGEYLSQIAKHYGVTVAEVRKENKLRTSVLKVGQKLRIKTEIAPTKKHRVKSGEYLSKIASRYQVSLDSLRRVNQLRSDQLQVNQILIIPNR